MIIMASTRGARLMGRYGNMPEIELLCLDHRLGMRERQIYEMSLRLGPNWTVYVCTPMNQHSIIGRSCCQLFHDQPAPSPEVVPLDYDEAEVVGFPQIVPPKQLTFTAIVELVP